MEEIKKIYVGNLPFSMKEEDLQKTIEEKGLKVVSVRVIKDKVSGRSKGFGFAEFQTPAEVQQA